MKRCILLWILSVIITDLPAQVIQAPPNMVVSCSMELDLSALDQVDHPVLGLVQTDTTNRASLTTHDQLCSSFCEDVIGSIYNNGLPVFNRACAFYSQNYDGNFDSLHVITWGQQGYAFDIDSLAVTFEVIEGRKPDPIHFIRRIFKGFHTNGIVMDTQLIFELPCGFFDVNVEDRFDTTDCVGLEHLPPEVFLFTDKPRDSIIYPPPVVPEECNGCPQEVIIEYHDEIILGDGKPYLQLKRTWSIIDWAIYDLNVGGPGRWDYCQIIHAFFSEGNLTGTVYHDENLNCQYDSSETVLRNWRVEAIVESDTFVTVSSNTGKYILPVGFGSAEVRAFPPNSYWSTCQQSWGVVLDVNNLEAEINIGAWVDSLCAIPALEIVVPALEYCDTNACIIEVVNEGTEPIPSGQIAFQSPDFFSVLSASVPFSNVGSGLYSLDVRSLAPGEFEQITMDMAMNCDSTAIGDIVCVEGEFTPFDSCAFQGFNGPIIEAEMECSGDSILLTLRNIGGDMMSTQDYWVVEDDLILFMDRIELDSLEEKQVSLETKGHTYHLVCRQVEEYPFFKLAVAGLANCQKLDVFPGFLNNTALRSPFPNVDIECVEVIGEKKEVNKIALPEGRGPDHLIWKDEYIEYTITFENIGVDTVQKVRIDDVMSCNLDINGLKVLSSSHPVNLKFLTSDTADFKGLELEMVDINLAPQEIGFITYGLNIDSDALEGDSITNKALVFMDRQPAKSTEEVFHIIEKDSTTGLSSFPIETAQFLIHPNPFDQELLIRFERAIELESVRLMDLNGRLITRHEVDKTLRDYTWEVGATLRFGVYLLEIYLKDGSSQGRVVIRK